MYTLSCEATERCIALYDAHIPDSRFGPNLVVRAQKPFSARSGTRGSGYFGQLLSAVAATPKTHLHACVSSGRDSACSYLAALSAPNKCKAARTVISLTPVIT